jgi:hypothetical protein
VTPDERDLPAFIPTNTLPPIFIHPTFTPTSPPTQTIHPSSTATLLHSTTTSTAFYPLPPRASPTITRTPALITTATPSTIVSPTPTRTTTPTKTTISTPTQTLPPYHTSID